MEKPVFTPAPMPDIRKEQLELRRYNIADRLDGLGFTQDQIDGIIDVLTQEQFQ